MDGEDEIFLMTWQDEQDLAENQKKPPEAIEMVPLGNKKVEALKPLAIQEIPEYRKQTITQRLKRIFCNCKCHAPKTWTCCNYDGQRRDELVSLFAGFLFATGWWIMIDGSVYTAYNIAPDPEHPERWMGTPLWWFYIPGVLGSIGLWFLNAIRIEYATETSFDDPSGTVARNWAFISFLFFAASLISAIWIFCFRFVFGINLDGPVPDAKWQGIAMLLQNSLIATANLILRFFRTQQSDL